MIVNQKGLHEQLEEIIDRYLLRIKNYGGDYFGYRYFKEDGGSFGITTNKKWYELAKTPEFYSSQKNYFEQELSFLLEHGANYVTRSREETKDKYLLELKQRGMNNSIGIYRFSLGKIEHFFFISSTKESYKKDLMINNLSELNEVVDEISPKISSLIALFPEETQPEIYLSKNIIDFVFNEIATINRASMLADGKKMKFAPRESVVLSWLRHGCSNKIIAKNMNISIRTVETYIETLKLKIGCSREQLSIYTLINKEKFQNILKKRDK